MRVLAAAALSFLVLEVLLPPKASAQSRPAGRPDAEGRLRVQHRRRLLPGQLPAIDGATGRSSSSESDRLKVVNIGATEEGRPQLMAVVTSPANHQQARRATRRSPAAWPRRGRRPGRGARNWPPRARRSSGSTAACTPAKTLCAQAMIETLYQLARRHRRRDAAHPRRRDHPVRPRQPGRARPRRRLVHAGEGPEEAVARRAAAALPEVHRPRQQPRLLRQHPGRDEEHEPRHVPRVVPADRLQPPPDRPARHGPVLPAVPRPVQLQLSTRWSSTASTPSGRR